MAAVGSEVKDRGKIHGMASDALPKSLALTKFPFQVTKILQSPITNTKVPIQAV